MLGCSEWSALVESNIVNRGYTFVMQQYYSAPQNKVRIDLHSNGSDNVIISVSDIWTVVSIPTAA